MLPGEDPTLGGGAAWNQAVQAALLGSPVFPRTTQWLLHWLCVPADLCVPLLPPPWVSPLLCALNGPLNSSCNGLSPSSWMATNTSDPGCSWRALRSLGQAAQWGVLIFHPLTKTNGVLQVRHSPADRLACAQFIWLWEGNPCCCNNAAERKSKMLAGSLCTELRSCCLSVCLSGGSVLQRKLQH